MFNLKKADEFIQQNLDSSLEELSEYCTLPTVAAQNRSIQEGAEFTAALLVKRGFETRIIQTGGSPVVFAIRKGKSDKTILFYNHYDVQPEDPVELWDSSPFEAEIRDGKIYARGISDDKGHLTSRLHAIDAILAQQDELPCTVKFVVEGEEEIGSIHMDEFVKKHADILQADGCVWEFGTINHQGAPLQILGLRGICYVELSIQCLDKDVHSGTGGSIFPNAAWRLVWALNLLKDQNEKIMIPGFYDNIIPLSDLDKELMAKLPDNAEDYKQRYGVKEFLGGVKGGPELFEQEVFQPTCTICGLNSGYQGAGSKTVLPAKASAKVDFRLVPEQTPQQVLDGLRKLLDDNGFDDIEITFLGGNPGAKTDPANPFIKLILDAGEDVYDLPWLIEPIVGGSGPNYPFDKYLNKIPIATAGIGSPGNNAHAPNENVVLEEYVKGAKHIVRILAAMPDLEV